MGEEMVDMSVPVADWNSADRAPHDVAVSMNVALLVTEMLDLLRCLVLCESAWNPSPDSP